MTTTAPTAVPRRESLIRRLNNTPLRDVLRGRLTGRLSIERLLAAADLPAPLAACVRDVVRRTRLWRLEKVAVARELSAHFEDGRAAGADAAELVASFGDPARAASLIRRAKKRNRPLLWKAAKVVENVVGFTLGLALLLYTVQAVRLYRGSPNIARNYIAEWNRPALAVPADQRAWPVYRSGYLATTGQWPRDRDGSDRKPGGRSWPEVSAFAAANSDALALYRQAGSMPKLGALLETHVGANWQLYHPTESPPQEPPADTACNSNAEFISIYLPQLGVLRDAAKLLATDAHLAAEAGNGDGVRRDLDAVFGIVAHAREIRMFHGDLVAIAVAHEACDAVGRLLRDHPQVLDDSHLTQIAHRLAVLGGEANLRIRFDSERAAMEDLLQRCFTDDGAGDGLPRPELLDYVAALAYGGGTPSAWDAPERFNVLIMPAMSTFLASRREMRAMCLDYLARGEVDAATPLWQRGPQPTSEEILHSSNQTVRYFPMLMLMPSFDRAGILAEYVHQNRDATLVAIALELHHRRYGSWPAFLDELTPQLLPQVPPDRYDGRPLKYRVVDDRPLVYSIGVDRDDDGGRLPDKAKFSYRTTDSPNDLARKWAPSPNSERPPRFALPDGDWILWPPAE